MTLTKTPLSEAVRVLQVAEGVAKILGNSGDLIAIADRYLELNSNGFSLPEDNTDS